MAKSIWKAEGPRGFCHGFSACFYGSAAAGFCFFMTYKKLKGYLKDNYGHLMNEGLCELFAGLGSELLFVWLWFPFDLLKVRLQSANEIF
jgi:hypothetical protein